MSVVTTTITSNGQHVSAEFELLYIDITYEYNKLPTAELAYLDGDFARQEFKVSDSAFFEPGSEIEIKIKYEDSAAAAKTAFKGVILKQGLQASSDGCTLIIELTDKAIKMTSTRKSSIIENITDSDVLSKLISSNGLTAGKIESTTVHHKRIVQYNATDWDFMASRAEANGLFISVKGGEISATTPSLSQQPVMLVKSGIDLYDFELEADARHQYASIESIGWDAKNQQVVNKKAKEFKLEQGNLNPSKLAAIAGGKTDKIISAVELDEDEGGAWANAKMVRSRLSMLKGRVKVVGSATVNVGDLIRLEGVGKRFSGTTLVTGIRHQVSAEGWTTDIQFGLDPQAFLSKNINVVDPKAGGLVPGINGLQIGIVEDILNDPDEEYRVKVKMPAIDNENGSIWSRMLSPDAGSQRGLVFWPEVGDEVILGFLNDDPRQPLILGSVHSSAHPSPVKADDKNTEKGIVTREGLKMLFNDEEKKITISTSDDCVITINEKEKSIEIKDANNNSVKLSDQGIAMQSDKDIVIKSGANVKIEGKAVEIKGNKVDII